MIITSMNDTDATPKKKRFVKELRNMPNISRAARLARIDRRTAYRWRNDDSDFAAAWDDALEDGIGALEEVAMKRAKENSDTLMIFLLKAHKPAMYRERYEVKHSGNVTWSQFLERAQDDGDD